MTHRKIRFHVPMAARACLVALLAAIILLSTAGCADESAPQELTNESYTNVVDQIGGADLYYPWEQYDNRESWNITMSFVRYDKVGIWIEIRDNDNIGMHFNEGWFVLERQDGSEWVKVSTLDENSLVGQYAEVPPRENADYAKCNTIARTRYLDQSKLVSGHYRFTKIISGREFQCEFDLEI